MRPLKKGLNFSPNFRTCQQSTNFKIGGLGPGGLDSWHFLMKGVLGVLNHQDSNPPIYHDFFSTNLKFRIQPLDRVQQEDFVPLRYPIAGWKISPPPKKKQCRPKK